MLYVIGSGNIDVPIVKRFHAQYNIVPRIHLFIMYEIRIPFVNNDINISFRTIKHNSLTGFYRLLSANPQ